MLRWLHTQIYIAQNCDLFDSAGSRWVLIWRSSYFVWLLRVAWTLKPLNNKYIDPMVPATWDAKLCIQSKTFLIDVGNCSPSDVTQLYVFYRIQNYISTINGKLWKLTYYNYMKLVLTLKKSLPTESSYANAIHVSCTTQLNLNICENVRPW